MGFDLRQVSPIVWWVLGGVVLLLLVARLKGYTLRDLMPRVKSPLPTPGPATIHAPHNGRHQTDTEKAAFLLLQAQAKHALERKADELERRKRDAAREITADFLDELAAETRRPFEPPGETGGK